MSLERSVYRRLPRPFIAMAPMEDITDTVFRRVLQRIAAPDLMYTEFAWVNGLCSPKATRFKDRLRFHSDERPLIAQLWGRDPEAYHGAARLVAELGYDGVDINMGCAVKKILKRGAGAGLIETPELAREIIAAVRSGAPDLPVGVKTRLGTRSPAVAEWCGFLLEQRLDALCVHARTAAQGYSGEADWDSLNAVLTLRDRIAPQTFIIGNGDLETAHEALDLHPRYPVDGFMLARAVVRDPLALNRVPGSSVSRLSEAERIALFRRHVSLHAEEWGGRRQVGVLKRFVSTYLGGCSRYATLRPALLRSESHAEMLGILSDAGAEALEMPRCSIG